jgi:hypothetical protein
MSIRTFTSPAVLFTGDAQSDVSAVLGPGHNLLR